MLWAFCKGLKFWSSDLRLGIISLMYTTHMPISKYNKYFTTSQRASIGCKSLLMFQFVIVIPGSVIHLFHVLAIQLF